MQKTNIVVVVAIIAMVFLSGCQTTKSFRGDGTCDKAIGEDKKDSPTYSPEDCGGQAQEPGKRETQTTVEKQGTKETQIAKQGIEKTTTGGEQQTTGERKSASKAPTTGPPQTSDVVEIPDNETCKDTDNGINYYEGGQVSTPDQTKGGEFKLAGADKCIKDDLVEWYVTSNGCTSTTKKCEFGCRQNACNPESSKHDKYFTAQNDEAVLSMILNDSTIVVPKEFDFPNQKETTEQALRIELPQEFKSIDEYEKGFDVPLPVPIKPPWAGFSFDKDYSSTNLNVSAKPYGDMEITQDPELKENTAFFEGGAGKDDYLVVMDEEGKKDSQYTVALWVKAMSLGNQSIFAKTSSEGPLKRLSQQLRISNGVFQHYTYDGTQKVVTGTTRIDLAKWYHVAITAKNNGQARLYVNGKEEGTAKSLATLWQEGDRYYIGYNSALGFDHYYGYMDDLSIYKEELTQQEIMALYDSTKPQVAAQASGNEAVKEATASFAPLTKGFCDLSKFDTGKFDSPLNLEQYALAEEKKVVPPKTCNDIFGEDYAKCEARYGKGKCTPKCVAQNLNAALTSELEAINTYYSSIQEKCGVLPGMVKGLRTTIEQAKLYDAERYHKKVAKMATIEAVSLIPIGRVISVLGKLTRVCSSTKRGAQMYESQIAEKQLYRDQFEDKCTKLAEYVNKNGSLQVETAESLQARLSKLVPVSQGEKLAKQLTVLEGQLASYLEQSQAVQQVLRNQLVRWEWTALGTAAGGGIAITVDGYVVDLIPTNKNPYSYMSDKSLQAVKSTRRTLEWEYGELEKHYKQAEEYQKQIDALSG